MNASDVARQAQGLRDWAASLLQEATRCTDPVRRDTLLNDALVRLNEARQLLEQLGAERRGADQPMGRMH